jgi:hypothetical protein
VKGALGLLIGLQLRGWVRALGRNLRTVKGVLLVVVGLGFFVLWLLMVLLARTEGGLEPAGVRRYGPALLLAYCVLNVLFSSSERAIYFSPAEVNFLFPGPFSRRAVLAYKMALMLLVGLPTALLMAVLVRVRDSWFVALFVGILLLYAFMQLFTVALALLGSAVGARLYTRGRRLALAAAGVAALVLLQQSAGPAGLGDLRQLGERALDTPAWHALSLPLQWFFAALLAQRPADLVLYALLAAVVDGALLGGIFALDAQYLEGAAAASARVYARIQRLRGRAVQEAEPAAGRPARWSVPGLPWWGGVGPIFWRQLTGALRGLGRLVLVLVVLGGLLAAPLLSGALKDSEALAVVLVGVVLWVTLFLTALVPFDFRGDVDRLGLLKTLPLPAWRLTLGQLLTPVLLLCLVQWLALAVATVLNPRLAHLWLACAAFVPPFNFLLIGLENLLFLLFPVRLLAATPGDFQALGRNVLLALAKVVVLFTVSMAALLVGLLTLVLTGSPWVGAAAAWPVVAVGAAVLVPCVAVAFQVFDVSRDTPA